MLLGGFCSDILLFFFLRLFNRLESQFLNQIVPFPLDFNMILVIHHNPFQKSISHGSRQYNFIFKQVNLLNQFLKLWLALVPTFTQTRVFTMQFIYLSGTSHLKLATLVPAEQSVTLWLVALQSFTMQIQLFVRVGHLKLAALVPAEQSMKLWPAELQSFIIFVGGPDWWR